MSVEVTDPEV